jgi:ComF family protein
MTRPALLSATLDLFFPRRCLACSVFLDHPLSGRRKSGFGVWLCSACRAGLAPAEPALISFPDEPLDRVYSGYYYGGVLEKIIPAWKYHRRYDLFPLVSALCGNILRRTTLSPADIDLVVAVPLTSRALRKRGFNQSFHIAEAVAGGLGLKAEPARLQKVVETPHQAALDRQARLQNLKPEVFRVDDPARVRGRRVLLCDDVMTTGSTLQVAASVLKQAGAAAVSGFTLARVP